MYSIKNNDIYEEVIKYSHFISLLYKVYNKNDVINYLNKTKEKYKGATHYTYAYIINNDIKSSDDGEPSKTAGIPILNQITSNNLNFTLIIVVRYFGGVKLGVGPLTRAYAKMAREVIKKDNIVMLEKGYEVIINTSYENIKKLDYLLRNSNILNKDFSEKIEYRALINKNLLDSLTDFDIEIINETYIEKKEDI